MNFLPLLGFYWRQHDKLHSLTDRANVQEGGGARLMIDLLEANAPVLKDRYPDLNENNFLDDAIATLKDATAGTRQLMMKATPNIEPSGKITQDQLEAGADAVHAVAESYGMASFITRDQERELAAAVLRSQ